MLAGILVEYKIKKDVIFDYLVPDNLKNKIKVGSKVIVQINSKIVEGFVMYFKNELDSSISYKEILSIKDENFYINEELIELGKFVSEKYMCLRITAYQSFLPKGFKASYKSKVNRKTESYLILNENINIEDYIQNNKRKKKEIELINIIKNKKEVLKKDYNCLSLTNLIKNNIILVKNKNINREVNYIKEGKKEVILNTEQLNAYNNILNSNNKISLLYGVTGSGKTEVYIKLIHHALSENKTSIMLVPEISLTLQIVSRFKNEFKDDVAIIHSGLSTGEKYDEYNKIFNNEVKVVIGARSAIFSPLKNIGLIIIDECQSSSYKQDNNPKYNAIDIAIKRCEYHNSICVLGSATPTLEQYARALKGVYNLVKIKNKVNQKNVDIVLVDMNDEIKKRNFVLSKKLDQKINECINNKNQVILLLNRRGYSTFISCINCGYVFKCPECDIALTYHKTTNNLRCHYCGYITKMSKICPHCKEEAIKDLGMGTEKLESIIIEKYKNAKVVRLDTDTTSKKGSLEKIISDFKEHKYDILIGTQMVSKGLNFPDVTLVGIVNADMTLNIPDFRSSERTFELLMQTSGRSGRFHKNGEVIIQTYNTNHYCFTSLIKQDYEYFFNIEMNIRKKLSYPPYYFLTSLKISGKDFDTVSKESNNAKKYLETNLSNQFIVIGPAPSRIFMFNKMYNFQILIKYKKIDNLYNVLNDLKLNLSIKKIILDINIEPINLI